MNESQRVIAEFQTIIKTYGEKMAEALIYAVINNRISERRYKELRQYLLSRAKYCN
jgi:hypothetical protein